MPCGYYDEDETLGECFPRGVSSGEAHEIPDPAPTATPVDPAGPGRGVGFDDRVRLAAGRRPAAGAGPRGARDAAAAATGARAASSAATAASRTAGAAAAAIRAAAATGPAAAGARAGRAATGCPTGRAAASRCPGRSAPAAHRRAVAALAAAGTLSRPY